MLFNKYIVKTTTLFLLLSYLHHLPHVLTQDTITTQPVKPVIWCRRFGSQNTSPHKKIISELNIVVLPKAGIIKANGFVSLLFVSDCITQDKMIFIGYELFLILTVRAIEE
jgi:hypothetical protein